jgi:hypothetical protein
MQRNNLEFGTESGTFDTREPKWESAREDLTRHLTIQACRGYAFSMPEPAQAVPQKTSGSFANLLASLTSKLQNDPWDDRALPDDVATITYEQALRTARQSRASQPPLTDQPLDNDIHTSASLSVPVCKPQNTQLQKKHRTASITIRVTSEEQAQLHERAAAAQLSVSAYLRSCIFEAETLRTQVKEALAQMQSASLPTTAIAPAGKASLHWRTRFFPAWSRSRTAQS